MAGRGRGYEQLEVICQEMKQKEGVWMGRGRAV